MLRQAYIQLLLLRSRNCRLVTSVERGAYYSFCVES